MSVSRQVRTLFIFMVLSGVLFIGSCTQEPTPEPQQTAVATLEQVKGELEKVKMAVANEGDYLCCVEPACDWCLLKEGECTCRINLEEGEEVCAGCGLGWHNGNGIIDGVKAGDVKWNISHSHGEDSDEGGNHGEDNDAGGDHAH